LKPIVLYSTIGGNTEKVAKEIAAELNCQCVKIAEGFDSSTLDLNDFDFVFVGTGNIWGNPNVPCLAT
jgi:flavodoxin